MSFQRHKLNDCSRRLSQGQTESQASATMRWRLRQRGFIVSDMPHPRRYDCVALLNVLDRCDEPLKLLRDIRDVYMKPDGVLFVAVVLPWCPFVENGTEKKAPKETLPLQGARCRDKPTFEAAASLLATRVFEAEGFTVEKWTRLPYLCEGNSTNAYFVLDDAVFTLRIAGGAHAGVNGSTAASVSAAISAAGATTMTIDGLNRIVP